MKITKKYIQNLINEVSDTELDKNYRKSFKQKGAKGYKASGEQRGQAGTEPEAQSTPEMRAAAKAKEEAAAEGDEPPARRTKFQTLQAPNGGAFKIGRTTTKPGEAPKYTLVYQKDNKNLFIGIGANMAGILNHGVTSAGEANTLQPLLAALMEDTNPQLITNIVFALIKTNIAQSKKVEA